jgi:PPOX class probable F420-dependent enzyme
VSLFPPEAVELLSNRATAVMTTLLPDGTPHSVVAGVVLQGEQLVSFTGPTAKRLKNLAINPAIALVVVDPESSMRYVEIRGTATVEEGGGDILRERFKQHAQEHGENENTDQLDRGITVVQIRVTPTKVSYHQFDPSQLGPITQQGGGRPGTGSGPGGPASDASLSRIVADGEIKEDKDGFWIEFERHLSHSPEEVWAALTEPARMVVWQHPVQFIPWLREGATIFAQLNPQAKAYALGKVTELRAPTTFAFRWTTNNPVLPPDFTIAYTFVDGVLRVRSGPFNREDGFLLLAASFHIHLHHIEEAITTSVDDLPEPPFPQVSVVTRTGMMGPTAKSYFAKYPEFAR